MDKNEEKRFKENELIDQQNQLLGKEPFPKTQKLKTPDGTIVYHWDGKMHNWNGPAFIPEGDNRRREYYLYGIKKTEEEWKEACRSGQGIPWYKDPRFKARNAG